MPSLPAGRRGGTAVERLQPDNSGRPRSCQPRWALWGPQCRTCWSSIPPPQAVSRFHLPHEGLPPPNRTRPSASWHVPVPGTQKAPSWYWCRWWRCMLRRKGLRCQLWCPAGTHGPTLVYRDQAHERPPESGHGAVSSDRALCI